VIETAASELADIGANPTSSIARPAWAAMQSGLDPVPLREAVAGEVRPLYLAVFGAVLLLLGIACANVVGLMLAGAAQRAGELGLAAALGASRMRLVQQILTERLLLSALGGAMGLAVAWLGARGLSALAPAGLPGAREADLDGGTLLFAFGLTTLIAAAIALFPALTGAAGRPQAGLRTGSGAAHRFALRRGLVVSEVAVAMVLLVGAGLLLRSVERLFAVPTGFESERVLALQVQTWGQRYQDDATRWGFFDEALEAVRDVPGVVSAAWTSQLPLSGQADVYGVFFEGDLPGEDGGSAFRYAVSPGYLETMRIPILRGQAPEHSDVPRAPVGVLVNESFARQRFGDGDPIGERLHFGRTDLPWYTVMGVVGDVRQSSLAAAPANAIYVLHRQWYFADPALWMVARVREETPELTARVKQAIWSIDASQPVLRAVTMEDLVTSSEARRRFALIVFEAFAGAALVLAQVGLYGVLSAIVVERTREIGVRSALGATGGAIVALVLRQGALLTCAGVTVGLAGAAVATRALGTLLFGVSPLDPWTYGGVVALLVGVGVLAAWLPARRAARVDPVAALKAR
jgi:putative ABC transport system permease protein